MGRLDDQLARLAAMPFAGLRQEWQRVYDTPPPRLSSGLLRIGIAYRLQEKAFGGLSRKAIRNLQRGAPAVTIKPGTRLVRDWNGRTVDVLADDGGFVFDGERYASLSAIARRVTGTAWSGPRFFGIEP